HASCVVCCVCYPTALPPSPTRRSSDLRESHARNPRHVCRPDRRHPEGDLDPGIADLAPVERHAGEAGRRRGHALEEQVRRIPHEDRKSTRLNSSHVKISYDVFCLKKKK